MQVEANVIAYHNANDSKIISAIVQFNYSDKLWRIKVDIPRIMYQSEILSFKLDIDANMGVYLNGDTLANKPLRVISISELNNWILGY